jgi:hypothetical protein
MKRGLKACYLQLRGGVNLPVSMKRGLKAILLYPKNRAGFFASMKRGLKDFTILRSNFPPRSGDFSWGY